MIIRVNLAQDMPSANLGGPEKGRVCVYRRREVVDSLSTESVEGSALSLESVDDIHGGDGLSLGVFGVGDGISDDIFQENFEDTSGFFIDQSRDSLDTTSSCKTSDSWLGDTLDVITKYFSVTLGASFSQTFSTFASSSHFEKLPLLYE